MDKVAIPPPGEAGTADLIALLPPEEADLLNSQVCLAAKPPAAASLRRFPVHCDVVCGQYPELLRKLVLAGMVYIFDENDGVIENGIFAVPKERNSDGIYVRGGPQRLIWDGRRRNLFFNNDLAAVVLPASDMFAELILSPHSDLYLSVSDVSQMYNRLRARAGCGSILVYREFGAQTTRRHFSRGSTIPP